MFHTPTSMKIYKWFLLNISICSYLLDIFLTIIFIPLPIFPVLGGCALGIISPLRSFAPYLAWFIYTQLLSMCGISIMFALLFRLAAIYGRTELFEKKSVMLGLVAFQVFYPLPLVYAVRWVHPNENEASLLVKRDHPYAYAFYSTHSCTLLAIDVAHLLPYFYLALALMTVIMLIYFVSIGFIARGLKRMKSVRSEKTYQMHKTLSVSLLFQFIVPICMIVSADLTFSVAVLFKLSSAQTIFYVTFIFSTLHTTANSVLMIALIRPYRDALISLMHFGKYSKGKDTTAHSTFVLKTVAVQRSTDVTRRKTIPF
ncbi:serpentine type 7TM GPCR chemoreceptor srh domain-containing protein [Ditylenchus destructor]|uniref:Serpentine type 7TM GPCR chemoreceptor srh domain-containing protein n=1 Tax=Ditylenchus destructor TaxID=166010 RepID=A0AAD4MUI6_9BILA|nr:serpentine type 7TM GPCR chemoreceptor srh domain-containing protein [Ditylenchus destructor]